MTATGLDNTQQHTHRNLGPRITSITALVTTRQHPTSLQEEPNDTERSSTQAWTRPSTTAGTGTDCASPTPTTSPKQSTAPGGQPPEHQPSRQHSSPDPRPEPRLPPVQKGNR